MIYRCWWGKWRFSGDGARGLGPRRPLCDLAAASTAGTTCSSSFPPPQPPRGSKLHARDDNIRVNGIGGGGGNCRVTQRMCVRGSDACVRTWFFVRSR